MPLWVAVYLGYLAFTPPAPGSALLWHAHEMLFGYLFAVIAGFICFQETVSADIRNHRHLRIGQTQPNSAAQAPGTFGISTACRTAACSADGTGTF